MPIPRCFSKVFLAVPFRVLWLNLHRNKLFDYANSGKPRNTEELVPVHPDHECLSDYGILGHHTPNAAVGTVIAVVTHHDIVAFRHAPYARIESVGLAADFTRHLILFGGKGFATQSLTCLAIIRITHR